MNQNLVLILGLFILLVGCNDEKKSPPAEFPKESQPEGPVALGALDVKDTLDENTQVATATKVSLRIGFVPPPSPDQSLRFLFDQDQAGVQNLSNAPLPDFKSTPELKGRLIWTSPRELTFIPSPGQITLGKDFQVSLIGKDPKGDDYQRGFNFSVSSFQMGGKVSNDPVVPGQPKFLAILNSGTQMIGSAPLFLLFDQKISPAQIKDRIEVKDDNNRVLNFDLRVQKTALPFDLMGTIDPAYTLGLLVKDLPAPGEYVVVYLDGVRSVLAVAPALSWKSEVIDSWISNKAARLETSGTIEFSSPVSMDVVNEFLKVEPSPQSISFSGSGNRVYFHMQFGVAQTHRIYFEKGFTDTLGQTSIRPLDLTFRSQDLEPILTLPDGALVIEKGANRLPLKLRNLKNVKVRIHKFTSAKGYIQALNQTTALESAELPVKKIQELTPDTKDLKMNNRYTIDLGIDQEQGLKLVEILAMGDGSEGGSPMDRSILVQTTGMGLSCKIWSGAVLGWAVDLDNGKIVSGATVKAYDGEGNILGSGKTDEKGTSVLQVGEISGSAGPMRTFYLAAEKDGDISLTTLKNEDLSNAWQFNLNAVIPGDEKLEAALFTDRGAYRPGETVNFKAFLRPQAGVEMKELLVESWDPRGQKIFTKTLALDMFRGADTVIPVKDGGAVGEYVIRASSGVYKASTTFRVEEYRVPTFTVKLTKDQGEWLPGRESALRVKADYLHGGSLSNRSVAWRVFRQQGVFQPSGYDGYIFTRDRDPSVNGLFAQGEGSLDEKGHLEFKFSPDSNPALGYMQYIAEASVTDYDRQNIAGRVTQNVHATDLYIGVKPPTQAVLTAGETAEVPVIVVTKSGQLSGKMKIMAYLDRIEFHTATQISQGENAKTFNRTVFSTELLSEMTYSGSLSPLKFKVPLAGAYQVRLVGQDTAGQEIVTTFGFTSSGGTPSVWPRFDFEKIEVIQDKPSYKVGDVAKLVLQSPYKNATGLLTIEYSGVTEQRIFEIKDNTPALEIPIRGEFSPNVYVSAILVRSRSHHIKDAVGFETGAPGYKIGYCNLVVDSDANRLKVKATPNANSAGPGETMEISIDVAEASGKPVGASAAIMVVDEGVLSLTGYKTPDPVALAYLKRTLGVRNGSNILDMPNSKRSRHEALFPGGDGDLAGEMLADGEALRKLFKSTAYWNPSVPVGNDGKGKVKFSLPDNLTTFRIMVVAADKEGRMGSGEASLLCSKPLLIQPVVPRFAYPGDEFTLEARVFNGTSSTLRPTLKGQFTGFDLIQGPPDQMEIKSGSSGSFQFKVKVKSVKSAILRFQTQAGKYSDNLEITLPILSAGNKSTTVGEKMITGSGQISLDLPANIILGTLVGEVTVSSTPLTALKDSVQYLMQYPNGCIEQTTSTAYPLVVLEDLLPSIGVEVDRAELKKFAEAGVKRILSFQTTQGGLSYWPGGSTPHAFATAFGLTALIEAKKKGYDVPTDSLGRMADFLEKTLREGAITEEMPHSSIPDGDTRALFVMTLGRLGRPQHAYIQTLWSKKATLTPFGLSFLAIAIKEGSGDKSLLAPILAEIKKAAKEDASEEFYEGNRDEGWSMGSPLRTHAGALMAYSTANPGSVTTGKFLKGLLSRKNGYGIWGNTQENVFGIMGVYQSSQSQGTEGAGPDIKFTLKGKTYGEKDMEHNAQGIMKRSFVSSELSGTKGNLVLDFSSTQGKYVTLRTSFETPLTGDLLKPKSQGFTIQRIYEALDGRNLEGQILPLGTVVKVRLKVNASKSFHYAAVDDKLPGGMEAMNSSMSTTESVTKGKLSDLAMKTQGVTSYSEIRDSRVAFYVDEMLGGEYEFVYYARTTLPGRYLRAPGRVEAMYLPESFGTTQGDWVEIR